MTILVAHAIMRALLCCFLNNLKESTKRRLFLLEFLSSLFKGEKVYVEMYGKAKSFISNVQENLLFYSFDEVSF